MMQKLCFILVLKALLVAVILSYAGIGLGPDEAQYWTWSQQIDWGYFSKPPGIAWQIWLGTKLFGSTEGGVRALSYLFSFLTAVGIYFLASLCRLQPRSCFWAAVAFAFSPLGLLSSFLAITDGGMLLFWTVSLCLFLAACQRPKLSYYLLLGVTVGLGALFKWPIYLFWLFVVGALFFCREWRNPLLWWSVGISLFALLPTVYWNSQHDFATFRHIFATIGGHKQLSPTEFTRSQGNPLSFFFAQAGLLSPFLFAFLLASWVAIFRRKTSRELLFCASIPLVTLALFLLFSFFRKLQGNWCDFAYPSAFVLMGWFVFEARPRLSFLFKGSVVISSLLALFVLHIPYLQAHTSLPLPYSLNLFRHNVGWQALSRVLEELPDGFYFGDKYQTVSVLSFYNPKQERAYFLNTQQARKNQFSYWPSLVDEKVGQDGYFVLIENAPHLAEKMKEKRGASQRVLEEYFSAVEEVGLYELFSASGKPKKEALVLRCTDFLGKLPPEVEHY